MHDVDVFTKLLGLNRPWSVEQVILDPDDESVHVFVRHRRKARFRCPKCGVMLPLHDHTPPRKWRHLDHGSWMTWLYARIPRVAWFLLVGGAQSVFCVPLPAAPVLRV